MTHWYVQKGVAILSILANSSSQKCNAFQSIQGFFLDSMNAPRRVIEVLSHGGWSISPESIYYTIRSVTDSLKESLRKLSDPGLYAMAYDNLDFDFKTKEPSDQNQGTFSSITTATFIPLTYGATLDDLRYSKELWEKSSLNPKNPNDSKPPTTPDRQYVFDHIQERQDNVLRGMEWFVWKILVDNHLETYKEELGTMPSSFTLDRPERMIQYPAHAMHLKTSVNDDNIAIVKNLEQQVGTSPEWYDSFIRLCHGDLGMQERHDVTTESRAIEATPQE